MTTDLSLKNKKSQCYHHQQQKVRRHFWFKITKVSPVLLSQKQWDFLRPVLVDLKDPLPPWRKEKLPQSYFTSLKKLPSDNEKQVNRRVNGWPVCNNHVRSSSLIFKLDWPLPFRAILRTFCMPALWGGGREWSFPPEDFGGSWSCPFMTPGKCHHHTGFQGRR